MVRSKISSQSSGFCFRGKYERKDSCLSCTQNMQGSDVSSLNAVACDFKDGGKYTGDTIPCTLFSKKE